MIKQISCPAITDCAKIRRDHEKELYSYDTPQRVVWGGDIRKCCNHIWCLPHKSLLETEKVLASRWKDALTLAFADFEELYLWVGTDILAGIWSEPRVLHYDIALRISYQRYKQGTDDIRPSKFVYIHGKPWRSAKLLDSDLKLKEFCKSSSYMDQLFTCPFHCDAVQGEHVLCVKHRQIH